MESISKTIEILSTCPRCGGLFNCGIQNGSGSCWCFDIEVVDRAKLRSFDGCLCEICLLRFTSTEKKTE